ncbi:MAG TPA: hypothetical protein DDX71_00205 [Ruminococcus sp.]|nr:hypothetical protein [Ruminococcus sp.]
MNEEEKKPRKDTASAYRNAMEMEAKLRREEELRERARQAAEEEANYQAREEYARELAEEKVDLIRLKQGVITDSDKIFRDEGPAIQYTIWQKIGNWFYHSKWWLGIASFIVLVAAFLIYDYVTREDPDLRMMLLSEHPTMYAESDQLCTWLEQYAEDWNGDGKISVGTVYIPVSKDTMEMSGNYSAAYNSQLLVQFQSATCMLVLADDASIAYLQPEDMFVNLEQLYPDCPYVNGWRLNLTDTKFASLWGLTEPLKDGSCLALRIPQEAMNSQEEADEAYACAKALLDRIVPLL